MAEMDYGKATIAAYEEKKVPYGGKTFKVIRATGDYSVRINGGGKLKTIEDFDLYEPEGYRDITLCNETAGEIEIEYYYGDGRIRSSTSTIVGSIEVENSDGQPTLNVFDATTKNKVGDVLSQLQSMQFTDITGFSSAVISGNSLTTTVVDAATNTDGIEIFVLDAGGHNNTTLYLEAGAGNYVFYRTESGSTAGGNHDITLQNIKIPAGVDLKAHTSKVNASISLCYKVL